MKILLETKHIKKIRKKLNKEYKLGVFSCLEGQVSLINKYFNF